MASTKPSLDNVWKLAEAKNKLSEVVNRTIAEGRQEIHRRDDVVVVISKSELEELEGKSDTGATLLDLFLSAPRGVAGEPSLTEIVLEGRKGEHDQ